MSDEWPTGHPARARAEAAGSRLAATLESLEQHLLEQGVPLVSALNPGLSDSRIDQIMTSTGRDLPEIARAIFRWHDGAHNPAVGNVSQPYLRNLVATLPGAHWTFRPLQELVDFYQGAWRQENLRYVEEMGPQDYGPEGPWGAIWFPVFIDAEDRDVLLVPTKATSRGRWVYPEKLVWGGQWSDIAIPEDAPKLLSLIVMFESLLMWMRHGYMRWDPDAAAWHYSDNWDLLTYRSAFWR